MNADRVFGPRDPGVSVFSDRPADYYEPLLARVWFACFSGSHLSSEESVALAHRAAAGPELVLVTEGPCGALLRTADGQVGQVRWAAAIA